VFSCPGFGGAYPFRLPSGPTIRINLSSLAKSATIYNELRIIAKVSTAAKNNHNIRLLMRQN
jgi:hypothetical protein